MVCMTCEFADLDTMVTPPRDRYAMMKTQLPPQHWAVLIAPYDGQSWIEKFNHRALAQKKDNFLFSDQCNVFVLGKTCVVVLNGSLVDYKVMVPFAFENNLHLLWPPNNEILSSYKILNDSDLDRIARFGMDD